MIQLSSSTLSIFRNCPRCFWLDKISKLKRPRGIFPSLPSGMDKVIKQYFDTYRESGTLPEAIKEQMPGVTLFQNQKLLNKWRYWGTGLEYKGNDFIVVGALDDLGVCGDYYIPIDYKTKGSPSTLEQSIEYYQPQLDLYDLLLSSNGYPTKHEGWLIYFSPEELFRILDVSGNETISTRFKVEAFKLQTDKNRAIDLINMAVDCLKGPKPAASPKCEYCNMELARAGQAELI